MPEISITNLHELEQDLKPLSEGIDLSWNSAACTHTGRVRIANEDAYAELQEQDLWLVADGMGGHQRGSCASKAIVKAFNGFSKSESLEGSVADIRDRLIQAHEACRELSKGKRAGSTVALLFVYHGAVIYIWSGDSRIYRLRAGQLQLMTQDHTVAQEKLRQGELTKEEAEQHSSAHILTQAVGVHRDFRWEMRYSKVKKGDRYLICSDGMYNDIAFTDVEHLVGSQPIESALNSLLAKSLDAGGRDNITGILLEAL